MRLARVKAQRIGKAAEEETKPPLCLRVDGMSEAIPDFFSGGVYQSRDRTRLCGSRQATMPSR